MKLGEFPLPTSVTAVCMSEFTEFTIGPHSTCDLWLYREWNILKIQSREKKESDPLFPGNYGESGEKRFFLTLPLPLGAGNSILIILG